MIVEIPDAQPPSLVLLNHQESVVTLKRAVGELKSSQYLMSYMRTGAERTDSRGPLLAAGLSRTGKAQTSWLEVGVMVLDLNGDGVFDRQDSRSATTIGLDVNNDGIFYGAAEYRKLEEIIDVCGVPLQVTDLDPAGLSITFRASALTVPSVNTPVPTFSVTTEKGQLIRSSDFRRKVHILDFWASWCAPCVAKLVQMESYASEHPDEVTGVIGINVDEPEGRSAAERIIREKALSFPQVIRAQGERDFLWKLFGSMQSVRLSIPLYVVVDGEGVIRYAADGGDDLAGLKDVVHRIVPSKVK